MTPLALQVLRGVIERPRDWSFYDKHEMLSILREPHCFEVTAAFPLLDAIGKKVSVESLEETLFLPADETWIEWQHGSLRAGMFLRRGEGGEIALFHVTPDGAGYIATLNERAPGWFGRIDPNTAEWWLLASACLALINTPGLLDGGVILPTRGSFDLPAQIRPATTLNCGLGLKSCWN